MTFLPTGKFPNHLLKGLLDRIPVDNSVIVGPGIGRDAAAVRFGDQALILKTDPITFATDEVGWYLVNINANDIACMGGEPRWLLVTALLPESSTTPEMVETIFADLQRACERIGCSLIGGHTEITEGLDRPILVGNMIGVAEEKELVDPECSEPGDVVLLVGGIAVEGTAILASEFADRLSSNIDSELLGRAREFLYDPGISVVDYARRLRQQPGVTVRALHDPTEGGLATGLHELAESTRLGIEIDAPSISVHSETLALCRELDIDPMGLIASGALLAVIPEQDLKQALSAFEGSPVEAVAIGRLTSDPIERSYRGDTERGSIPEFRVDEIARLSSIADH